MDDGTSGDNRTAIIFVLSAVIVVLLLSRLLDGRNGDYRCSLCDKWMYDGDVCAEISARRVCPECVVKILDNGEYGFCENCDNLIPSEEMVDGYCNECFIDAASVGFSQGYDYGRSEGYESGNDAGYKTGYDAGYASGYSAGFDEGREQGYEAGYGDGLYN